MLIRIYGFSLSESMGNGPNVTVHFTERLPIRCLLSGSQKPETDVRTSQLVQTIDLPATLLEYFGLPLFPDMEGKPLRPVIEQDVPVREGGLFGIFGGQVCCTDGTWVYMRSPLPDNQPRYEYTLMVTRHGGRRSFYQS